MLQVTWVLPIVGQDGSTIGSSAYPGCSSGRTINFQLWFLTSAKHFKSAVVPGGRIKNPPPSAIPVRW